MKKPGKTSRLLPTRGGLSDIVSSPRTINDYAKALPPQSAEPASILNLRNPRKGK